MVQHVVICGRVCLLTDPLPPHPLPPHPLWFKLSAKHRNSAHDGHERLDIVVDRLQYVTLLRDLDVQVECSFRAIQVSLWVGGWKGGGGRLLGVLVCHFTVRMSA
jgi:hypothetical protein